MIEDAQAWANRMMLPVRESTNPMSTSRPKPSGKVTVLMVQGKKKSRSPKLWKESEKRIQRKEREIDTMSPFHPFVGHGHTSVSTFTSRKTADPTNNFEGSSEGSAEGSGVGYDEELSHVGPRNRELTSFRRSGHANVEGSGRSGRNNAVVSAPDETKNYNIEGSGVDEDHGQAASNKDDDEDDSSGDGEPHGIDGDIAEGGHESFGKVSSVYDSIEGYPGIGTTMYSDKNYRDTLGKSETPETYDEDEYSGKEEDSDEEDIGSDEEEDSDEDEYPGDDNDVSSDIGDIVSVKDSGSGDNEVWKKWVQEGSGGEESSGEGSGQS